MFKCSLLVCYIFFISCMCLGSEGYQANNSCQQPSFSIIKLLLENNLLYLSHRNAIILSQVNKPLNSLIKDNRKQKYNLFKSAYGDNNENKLYITDDIHCIEIFPASVIFDASGMYACGYSISGSTKKDKKSLKNCYGYQIFTYPECRMVRKELTYAEPYYAITNTNNALTLTIVSTPASGNNRTEVRSGIAQTWSTTPSNEDYSQTIQESFPLPHSGNVNATLMRSGNNLQCLTCYYKGDFFENAECTFKRPMRYTIYQGTNRIPLLREDVGHYS